MARWAWTGLAILALAGAARASVPEGELPLADHVVVDKTARTLTVFAQGRPVRTIDGNQLGDAPQGHKRFQGDERMPEGRYVIDWSNPESAYHLSLQISYPNAADHAFAASQGRSRGGMIMIHGQPNGMSGRMQGDWTDGCIALANEDIEDLWQARVLVRDDRHTALDRRPIAVLRIVRIGESATGQRALS